MSFSDLSGKVSKIKTPLAPIYGPMFAGLARVMYRLAASQHWLVGADAFMDAALPSQSARDAYRAAADHNLLPTLSPYADISFPVNIECANGRTVRPRVGVAVGFGRHMLGHAYNRPKPNEPHLALYGNADESGQITETSNRLADLADDLDSAITVIEWLHENAGKTSHVATYFPSMIQLVQFGAKYSPVTQQAWKYLRAQKSLTDDHPFVPSKIRQAMDRFAGLIAVTSVLGDDAEQELDNNVRSQLKKLQQEPLVMLLSTRPLSADLWSLMLRDLSESLKPVN